MDGNSEHTERAGAEVRRTGEPTLERTGVEVRRSGAWTLERIAAERNDVPATSLRERRSLEQARFERLASRVSALLASAQRR